MSRLANFSLFVGVGGLCAVINIVARLIFNRFVSFEIAVILAFPIALSAAFVLNRTFVFRRRGTRWTGEYVRFGVVNLIALAQVFVVSVGLDRVVFPALGVAWHPDALAHAAGVASPILTSYWAHRRFSFRAPTERGVEATE